MILLLRLSNGGSIASNVADSITLDGVTNKTNSVSSIINVVGNEAIGDGGATTIFANNLSLTNGGSIIAETFGEGDSGDITLNVTDSIIAFPDGANDIRANSQQGQGGNITIDAESVLGIQEGVLNESTNHINASSAIRSLDGSINIETLDAKPIQGMEELSIGLVVPEETISPTFAANAETLVENGLTVKGKGALASTPDLPLYSDNIILQSGDRHSSIQDLPQSITTSQGEIQPA